MEILPAAPDADYTGASRFYEFRCLMSSCYVRCCFLYLAIEYTCRRKSDDGTKCRRVHGVLYTFSNNPSCAPRQKTLKFVN